MAERGRAMVRGLAELPHAAAFALVAEAERFQARMEEAGRLSHTFESLQMEADCLAAFDQRLEGILERFGRLYFSVSRRRSRGIR